MAQFGTVTFAQLGQENRMDAGFHLLLNEFRPRLEEMKRALSAEAARQMLAKLPLADKRPLLPLARGQKNTLTSTVIALIEREYPHLALAIMEKHLREVLDRARENIAQAESAMSEIQSIAKTLDDLGDASTS